MSTYDCICISKIYIFVSLLTISNHRKSNGFPIKPTISPSKTNEIPWFPYRKNIKTTEIPWYPYKNPAFMAKPTAFATTFHHLTGGHPGLTGGPPAPPVPTLAKPSARPQYSKVPSGSFLAKSRVLAAAAGQCEAVNELELWRVRL